MEKIVLLSFQSVLQTLYLCFNINFYNIYNINLILIKNFCIIFRKFCKFLKILKQYFSKYFKNNFAIKIFLFKTKTELNNC